MGKRLAPLTEPERLALAAFRDTHGRTWKAYLLAAWRGGHYGSLNMAGRDSGILREIRNQRGPTWLLDHCKPRDLEPPTP